MQANSACNVQYCKGIAYLTDTLIRMPNLQTIFRAMHLNAEPPAKELKQAAQMFLFIIFVLNLLYSIRNGMVGQNWYEWIYKSQDSNELNENKFNKN